MKVEVYQRNKLITPQGSVAQVNPGAVTASAGAAADFGSAALTAAGDIVQRQKEADDNAWISRTTAGAAKTWAARLQQAKAHARDGADGFAPGVDKEFQTYRDQVLKTAPSPEAAALAGQRFDRLGLSLYSDALNFEATAKRAKRLTDFNAGLNDLASAAFANPAQEEVLIAQANGDLDAAASTWMLPTDASARRGEIPGVIAEAAIRGRIQHDPHGVLGALEGAGDASVSRLAPARRAVLASAARAEINRRALARNQVRQGLTNRLKDLSGVVEAGFDPGDKNFQALETDIAKFGDGDLSAKITALKGDLGFQTEVRAWTPTMLQDWINVERGRLNKGDGVSGSQADRLGLAEKVLSSMRREIQQDPLSWAARAGVANVQPVSFSGSDAEKSMQGRLDTALSLAKYYGTRPRFLTDEEEAQLKSTLEGASVDQQVALAFSLNKGFGSHAVDIFQRISGTDPLFAHAGGLASLGVAQAGTARDVLAGRGALKAGNKVLPPAADMNDWTSTELAGAFAQTPQTRAAVIASAKAIYTTIALRRGLNSETSSENLWRESIQRAAGGARGVDGNMRGGIGSWNDQNVMLPTGATQSDFEAVLGGVKDADLSALGHPVHGDGAPFTAKDLADARLIDFGVGQYLVDMSGTGDAFIQGDGPDGYFILDVRALAKIQAARGGVSHSRTRLSGGSAMAAARGGS